MKEAMKTIAWQAAGIFLAISVGAIFYGCGGGGGGGSDSPPNTTVYDISQYTSLNTGDTLSIALTGTDTSGGSYSGSIQTVVNGQTSFEGHNVIKRTTSTIMNKINQGNIASVVSEQYYNYDKTLYKIVFSNGVTAAPTNVYPLPTSIKVGDEFDGQDLAYSNGNTLMSNWEVVDAGNGNAKVITTTLSNTGLTDTLSLIISPSGDILSTREVMNNFPSNGVTTTLTGTVN